MPIGNLTSQIFANIYLNELDRFVVHHLKPKHYLRYGDDFILIDADMGRLKSLRLKTIEFIADFLKLRLNSKNDKLIKASHCLRFLGVVIKTDGRSLSRRNCKRIRKRLSQKNASSYYGLIKKHALPQFSREFDWWISELLDRDYG